MARLRLSFLGLVAFGALVGLGCGSDAAPQDDTASTAETGKKDAGKGTSKATDAGKKADAGAGASSTAAAEPVACGSTTCEAAAGAPSIPGLPAPKPCCFDEENEVCSVKSAMTGMCAAPATLDPRCPEVTVFGNTVKGCCTDNNHCGIDGTAVGTGCSDLADPTVRQLPMLPPPQTCDGDPIELPGASTDAGKAPSGGSSSTGDAGTASDAGKAADAGKADAGK